MAHAGPGGVSETSGPHTRPGVHSGVSGEALRVRQLVAVFAGRELPAPIALDGGPLPIGRAGFAAIALDDDEVSRRHAELVREPASDRWFACDTASRNGTFVDGVRIERAAISHGSVVRIGQ